MLKEYKKDKQVKCLYNKQRHCKNVRKGYDTEKMPNCYGCEFLPNLNEKYGNDTLEYDYLRSISFFRRKEAAKIKVKTSEYPKWYQKHLKESGCGSVPGGDHTDITKIYDEVVYVTQPYDMNMERFKELIKFCEDRNLDFKVDGRSSHFAGVCFRVIITEKRRTNINL